MANMKDCIKFANENPICFLATNDRGQPRVRAMGFWFANKTGFYFQTGIIKDLYRQLVNNPNVEVCFYKNGRMAGRMMRIAGKITFVNGGKFRKKVMADRPYLKDLGLKTKSRGLILFKIAHGKAHFWTMENNLSAKEIIKF